MSKLLNISSAFIVGITTLALITSAYHSVKSEVSPTPTPTPTPTNTPMTSKMVSVINETEKVDNSYTPTEKFVVTAYCPCQSCSGKWGYQTSTGVRATEGRTIAVDPTVVPYGSKVIVNGHEYIAEDCGGGIKGKKIDIFMDSEAKCRQWGVRKIKIKIVKGGKSYAQ